jgi:sortase (surface protein transpeptidase)
MDLKIGDKIYKRKNGITDKYKVYEIENIIEESEANWHNGYNTIWIAYLLGEK